MRKEKVKPNWANPATMAKIVSLIIGHLKFLCIIKFTRYYRRSH